MMLALICDGAIAVLNLGKKKKKKRNTVFCL